MWKYLAISLVITLLGLTASEGRVTEEVKQQCREETDLTEEDSRSLKANEALSQTKKCYIKCLFEKGGYIGADGKILVEAMKKDIIVDGNNVRLEKVYGCVGNIESVKDCDKVTELIDCFTLKS
ncbi:uncharacterized protein LOC135138323 [Zophobas morio]|uniref:uncharacterized protein LOC135138323 n=1 Tax=Zophobas morio TaxID=2755281 RepID=UPI0030830321